MKKVTIMLLILCSTFIKVNAVEYAPTDPPKSVLQVFNKIERLYGDKSAMQYEVNRNPTNDQLESRIKILPFDISKNTSVLTEVTNAFQTDERIAYQFFHLGKPHKEKFSLQVAKKGNICIRKSEDENMWLLCAKNPEDPRLRDAYAIVWEQEANVCKGTIYVISSLRPDIYEKELKRDKSIFRIEGVVDNNIADSCYNIYIADTKAELDNIGDDDYIQRVIVTDKRFKVELPLDHPVAGRVRAVFPGDELCTAWIDLDFVPGETYKLTVHNGYYDDDYDYEKRVGAYSGKSLVKQNYNDATWSEAVPVVDTIPNYQGEIGPDDVSPIITAPIEEMIKIWELLRTSKLMESEIEMYGGFINGVGKLIKTYREAACSDDVAKNNGMTRSQATQALKKFDKKALKIIDKMCDKLIDYLDLVVSNPDIAKFTKLRFLNIGHLNLGNEIDELMQEAINPNVPDKKELNKRIEKMQQFQRRIIQWLEKNKAQLIRISDKF